MKRYDMSAVYNSATPAFVGTIGINHCLNEKGEWVRYSDAEEEIKKALREGRDEVLQHRLAEEWPSILQRLTENARADERDRILAKADEIRKNSYMPDRIVIFCEWLKNESHPAQEPKCGCCLSLGSHMPSCPNAQEPAPLEKLNPTGKEGGVFTAYEVASIVNPLVEAVKELQRKAT